MQKPKIKKKKIKNKKTTLSILHNQFYTFYSLFYNTSH